MASVFGVGIATVDIINSVESYPDEDAEVRASTQHVSRGGNVCNTLTVLSQLKHQCYWSGVTCRDSDTHFILDDLKKNQIDYRYAQHLDSGKVPTSYITLNRLNGSRTIVHYRDLPELSYQFFKMQKIPKCDWFHFEAREISDTQKMISHIKNIYPKATISVEIEKERKGLEDIFGFADLYLFSKAYALYSGFDNPLKFLSDQKLNSPDADLTCTWGEKGAVALLADGTIIESSAFPPTHIVDTLGAGDTFNAGIIHARLSELDWQQTLSFACQLAGKKCGQMGFENLAAS